MSKLVKCLGIGVVSVGSLFVNADPAKAQCCDNAVVEVVTNVTYQPAVTYYPTVTYRPILETETVYEAPIVYSTPMYYTYRPATSVYRPVAARQAVRIARRNAAYCCN